MAAAILERDPGTGDEILDGACHEDLPVAGHRSHARADVQGNSSEPITIHLAFAGMDARPNGETELGRVINYSPGTADRAPCAVERGKESIAGVSTTLPRNDVDELRAAQEVTR